VLHLAAATFDAVRELVREFRGEVMPIRLPFAKGYHSFPGLLS